jgi:hypothetical protein
MDGEGTDRSLKKGLSRMGKAAENEKLKLRATFANNVSVALVAAGAFLPIITVIARFDELVEQGRSKALTVVLLFGAAGCVAFLIAWMMHRSALAIADKI